MMRIPGPELQLAIRFLSSPDAGKGPLPDRPDYEALAQRASELGQELSPGALKEAFRLLMRARLVAFSKVSRSNAGDR